MNVSEPLLSIHKLSKFFGGIVALDQVSLELQQGEVLAVVGENGAGKSTLMKIIAGVLQPDSGEIELQGVTKEFTSVQQAIDSGILLIHQELSLCDNLDVAANIFLGRELHYAGFLQKQRALEKAKCILDEVGLNLSPDTLVSELSLAKKQLVEIARALSISARIVIFDEPTSSLSPAEVQRLFVVIKKLQAVGTSVLYISHRLPEVIEIADRVLVLRDGNIAGKLPKEGLNVPALISLMVGRDLPQPVHSRVSRQRCRLAVNEIRTSAYPMKSITMSVNGGECVGLAGLAGAGRSELLETIFGLRQPVRGQVSIDGTMLLPGKPGAAVAAGCALIPEDRAGCGAIVEMSVADNLQLAQLFKLHTFGFVNRRAAAGSVEKQVEALSIKVHDTANALRTLSGGNQQKVVVGKWLSTSPGVLLLDEPTRGIDVGSKFEIWTLVRRLAAAGVAVLFASSEMEELQHLADRVIVMREGLIAGEFAFDEFSEEAIMRYATGAGDKQSGLVV